MSRMAEGLEKQPMKDSSGASPDAKVPANVRRAVSDRNLLFGILALQMDFISKEASIAAMSAWVLAKSKPLGQILVEQGALAGDRQALLEALVQEHLKTHNHDAQNEGLVPSSGRLTFASCIRVKEGQVDVRVES